MLLLRRTLVRLVMLFSNNMARQRETLDLQRG
jgi:hypothetical protein